MTVKSSHLTHLLKIAGLLWPRNFYFLVKKTMALKLCQAYGQQNKADILDPQAGEKLYSLRNF